MPLASTKPSPMDIDRYPHLVLLIISKAHRSAIHNLRATNHAFRDACDAFLVKQVMVKANYSYSRDGKRSIQYIGLHGPGYVRIPAFMGMPKFLEAPHSDETAAPVDVAAPALSPHSRMLHLLSQVKLLKTEVPGQDPCLLVLQEKVSPFMTGLRAVHVLSGCLAQRWTPSTLLPPALVQTIEAGLRYTGGGRYQMVMNGLAPLLTPSTTAVFQYHMNHHSRQQPGVEIPPPQPYPDTLQEVFLVLTDAGKSYDRPPSKDDKVSVRRAHEAIEQQVLDLLVPDLFQPGHFVSNPEVRYKIVELESISGQSISGHSYEEWVQMILDRFTLLVTDQSNLSQHEASNIVAERVTFISMPDFADRVGFEDLFFYTCPDFDTTLISYNDWVVVPHYIAQFEELECVMLQQSSPFACHGAVPLEGPLSNMALFFEDGEKVSRRIQLPFTEHTCKALYDACSPSPFGRQAQLVYDETYRSARELLPARFALSGDSIIHGDVLGAIQRALGLEPIYGTLSKLNIYIKGGHFKAHRDTPRGQNHVATIVVCLPSEFTGGQLVVQQGGQTVTYDWASDSLGQQYAIRWAFHYADCEHEILPVTSGTRVTLAYDVYYHPAESITRPMQGDTGCSAVVAALRKILDDPLVKPKGAILAFGLQYSYPQGVDRDSANEGFPSLKGTDAVWARALKELDIPHNIYAVYDDSNYCNYSDDEKDGKSLKSLYKNRQFLAAPDFNLVDYSGDDPESDLYEILGNDIVSENEDVVWVTVPGQYGKASHHITYGNEPALATVYVAAALFASVGPAGRRTEGKELE